MLECDGGDKVRMPPKGSGDGLASLSVPDPVCIVV